MFYEVYSYNDTSVRGMSGEYDSAHSSSTQVDSLASDTIIEYICTDEILISYVNSAKNSLVIAMRLYFLVICV